MIKINELILKIIAVVTMLIDHIGAIFFPHQIIFRIIGRIALPIFIYLLARGSNRTKNYIRYIATIFLFGIMAQPIYELAFSGYNILLAFTIYLIACMPKNSLIRGGILGASGAFLEVAHFDYGIWGLVLFLSFKNNTDFTKKSFLEFSAIWIAAAVIETNSALVFAILAYPIISFLASKDLGEFKIEEKINRFYLKYFFYAFYPLHLAFLLAAKAG